MSTLLACAVKETKDSKEVVRMTLPNWQGDETQMPFNPKEHVWQVLVLGMQTVREPFVKCCSVTFLWQRSWRAKARHNERGSSL